MARGKSVDITSFIHSTAANKITAYSDEIKDETQNKFQSEINKDNKASIDSIKGDYLSKT